MASHDSEGSSAPQQPAEEVVQPVDSADPRSRLRPELWVVGNQGKRLGRIDAIERDVTGVLTGLVVRHGLLHRKYIAVPVDRVRWVNEDEVVLQFSQADFERLPTVPGR
jgi:hypothetical protein